MDQTVLNDLAARESRLVATLPKNGYLEERLRVIEAAGLFEQWQDVFTSYVELIEDPVLGHEALRRALFLMWFSWNEPPAITGIGDLAPDSQRLVLGAVEKRLASSELDSESRSMLRGYGPGLPFDQFPEYTALSQFLADLEGPCSPDAPLGPMVGRGVMGDYWLSRNDLPNKSLQADRPSAGG